MIKIIIDNFKEWEKRKFLYIIILIVPVLYFSILKFFDSSFESKNPIHYVIIFFLIGFIHLFLFILKKKPFLKILIDEKNRGFGIAFYIEDDDKINEIILVLNPILKNINKNKDLKKLNFFIFSGNKFRNSEEITKYLETNAFNLKNILFLKISIGNKNNEKVFIINEGIFFSQNSYNSIQFIDEQIDIAQEIKFQANSRNWFYHEKDDLIEKKQLRQNIYEIILYYAGIYLLCNKDFKGSFIALKEIFKPNNLEPKLVKEKNESNPTILLKPENILAGRLVNLIVRVCQIIAFSKHSSGDITAAIKQLELGVKIIGKIYPSYWLYVTLAKFSYDNGDIDKAIEYTNVMEEIAGKETHEIHLNRGFFAILEGNQTQLVKHYKKLSLNDNKINYNSIIDFLNSNALKYPEKILLFEYCKTIIICNYFKLNKKAKKDLLIRFINKIANNEDYSCIKSHIKELNRSILK